MLTDCWQIQKKRQGVTQKHKPSHVELEYNENLKICSALILIIWKVDFVWVLGRNISAKNRALIEVKHLEKNTFLQPFWLVRMSLELIVHIMYVKLKWIDTEPVKDVSLTPQAKSTLAGQLKEARMSGGTSHAWRDGQRCSKQASIRDPRLFYVVA